MRNIRSKAKKYNSVIRKKSKTKKLKSRRTLKLFKKKSKTRARNKVMTATKVAIKKV